MAKESRSVGEFLRARRELMQPEDVGLTRGPHRRVPGLRRAEVAQFAGISAEYYLRLEQGRDHQPSAQVLAAIGRALQLDEDSLRYLHRLAYPLPATEQPSAGTTDVPESVQELLAQWADTPAYVTDRHHYVLAVNELATAMAPGYLIPGENLLAQMFLGNPDGPYSEGLEQTATSLVASVRYHGDLHDPNLQEIVGELSIRSGEFRRIWAMHDVRPLTSGRAPTYIDPLGWVNFRWQTLQVPGRVGQQLTMFFGDPGTPEVSAIAYLGARVRETRHANLTAVRTQESADTATRSRFSAAREDGSAGSHITSRSS